GRTHSAASAALAHHATRSDRLVRYRCRPDSSDKSYTAHGYASALQRLVTSPYSSWCLPPSCNTSPPGANTMLPESLRTIPRPFTTTLSKRPSTVVWSVDSSPGVRKRCVIVKWPVSGTDDPVAALEKAPVNDWMRVIRCVRFPFAS